MAEKLEIRSRYEDEDAMAAIIISAATIMIHRNARGFNSWI